MIKNISSLKVYLKYLLNEGRPFMNHMIDHWLVQSSTISVETQSFIFLRYLNLKYSLYIDHQSRKNNSHWFA